MIAEQHGDKFYEKAYIQRDLPIDLTCLNGAYQETFGKRIVLVESTTAEGDFFNGVRIPQNEDTLYLNATSDVTWNNVAGHELLHDLKNKRPLGLHRYSPCPGNSFS